jgi:hypothetical protein
VRAEALDRDEQREGGEHRVHGQHVRLAGNATRAERDAADVDFDSPLMRLAAGG